MLSKKNVINHAFTIAGVFDTTSVTLTETADRYEVALTVRIGNRAETLMLDAEAIEALHEITETSGASYGRNNHVQVRTRPEPQPDPVSPEPASGSTATFPTPRASEEVEF